MTMRWRSLDADLYVRHQVRKARKGEQEKQTLAVQHYWEEEKAAWYHPYNHKIV